MARPIQRRCKPFKLIAYPLHQIVIIKAVAHDQTMRAQPLGSTPHKLQRLVQIAIVLNTTARALAGGKLSALIRQLQTAVPPE